MTLHYRLREWRFLTLAGLTLALIAVHLGEGLTRPEPAASGWRQIDTDALKAALEAGDLSGREADWYHVSRPDEIPKTR